MANVSLRPMSDQEFDDWFADSKRAYAGDLARAYRQSNSDTQATVDALSTRMLPVGRHTNGHRFLRVLDGEDPVGWLWLGPGDAGALYIYDIVIAADRRGEGFGTAALLATEEIARSLGFDSVGLSVFGHNPRAKTLYEAVGYQTVTTQMRKPL